MDIPLVREERDHRHGETSERGHHTREKGRPPRNRGARRNAEIEENKLNAVILQGAPFLFFFCGYIGHKRPDPRNNSFSLKYNQKSTLILSTPPPPRPPRSHRDQSIAALHIGHGRHAAMMPASYSAHTGARWLHGTYRQLRSLCPCREHRGGRRDRDGGRRCWW